MKDRARISRRQFLVSAAALAASGRVHASPHMAQGAMGNMGNVGTMGMRGGSGSVVTRYPLHFPPTAGLTSTLQAAPATVDLGGGRLSTALTYNTYFPGPTFRANRGEVVNVTLANRLLEESSIHWHGLVVPTAADGQPQDPVFPGANRLYQFTINQRAALNWYHPHMHGMTGEQVALGLAGVFIVNDSEEGALGLPSGAYEVPLVLRDASYDSAGNLLYNPTSSGFMGKSPLVNGTRDATLAVDRAYYRLRVLNGATARIMRLALSSGSFTLIGNDGGLLPKASVLSSLDIAPGERLDLVVDFRGLAPGAKVMLRDTLSGWDLLEFDAVGPSVDNAPKLPATLSTIDSLGSPATTRTFTFDGMSRINGQVFDMNRIDFRVPLGQTERWIFSTGGNAPHPIHVHGASFQVIARRGGRGQLYPWEGGWKDTVLLQNKETVEVLVRFDGYPGRYIIHCHKLEHEDQGMMANFEVYQA
jgi:blue copper oxidase